MKRFHIHVGVKDVGQAIGFYSTLFGQKPVKVKPDYAKWLLDDPRLNFAISTRTGEVGVNHLGIQVENPAELEEITSRLKQAEVGVFDEGETTCCYAKSNKAWVSDPAGVPWETYQNMADAEVYSEPRDESESECCVAEEAEGGCDPESGCC